MVRTCSAVLREVWETVFFLLFSFLLVFSSRYHLTTSPYGTRGKILNNSLIKDHIKEVEDIVLVVVPTSLFLEFF